MTENLEVDTDFKINPNIDTVENSDKSSNDTATTKTFNQALKNKHSTAVVKYSKKCNNCAPNECNCDNYKIVPHFSDEFSRQAFYVLYRVRQRFEGGIWGAIEGFYTFILGSGKCAGSGGFLTGAIVELLAAVIGPVVGTPVGFILGVLSDKYTVCQYMKNFRHTMFAGGNPPKGMLA